MAMTAAQRKRSIRASAQKWREAKRAAGLCVDCGKPAARKKDGSTYSRCRRHLRFAAVNTHNYHTRMLGKCYCGENVARGERGQLLSKCARHHRLALARSRRFRSK